MTRRSTYPIVVLFGAAVAILLLLATAPSAFALSKNVFSASITGSGADTLTNPVDVAIDSSNGDVYVANAPINGVQSISLIAATGSGDLTAGSNLITNVSTTTGTFVPGERLRGVGLNASIVKVIGTTIEVSNPASASGTGVALVGLPTGGTFTLTFDGRTTPPLPLEVEAYNLTHALERLSNVGTENVRASGVSPNFDVEFTGPFTGIDQPLLTADVSGLTPFGSTATITRTRAADGTSEVEKFTQSGEFILMIGRDVNANPAAANPNVCTAASGDPCQPGSISSSPGAFTIPNYLAVDNASGGEGDLYVGDRGAALVSKFDSQGNPVTAWGDAGQLDGSTAPHGPFASARGNTVGGTAVDPDGTLVVSAGGRVNTFEFARDGSVRRSFRSDVLGPIAIDRDGNLYGNLFSGGLGKATPDGSLIGLVGPQAGRIGLDARTSDLFVTRGTVEHFAPSCNPTDGSHCSPIDSFGSGRLGGVAVDSATKDVFVADSENSRVAVFSSVPYLPDAFASAVAPTQTSGGLTGTADPAGAGAVTGCQFEWAVDEEYEEYKEVKHRWTYTKTAPCETVPPSSPPYPGGPPTDVHAEMTGLTAGSTYHFRLGVENANGFNSSLERNFTALPLAPVISATSVSEVHADAAVVHTRINPGGGGAVYHTSFRVEYVTQEQFEASGFAEAASTSVQDGGSAKTTQSLATPLSELTPNTTFRYRVNAENASSPPGGTIGPTRVFTTLPFIPDYQDHCPNSHVRQQTSAAQLLDCRAYELVSAASSGGYDVESNVVAGQAPYGGYPEADGRVLYGVHGGGVPGVGSPTNHGIDPYVATRGGEGWTTEYAGVPGDNQFSAAPFSSRPTGADSNLETFAFGGPEGCSPCFEDGSTGIPVHMRDGKLVQEMIAGVGVPPPAPSAEPDGHVAKDLSADGNHLIFGSTTLFATGGNDETGDVSIYDRDLQSGETHVVSNNPSGTPLACLQGVGKCNSAEGDANGISELDVSGDGSHILIGQKVTEDAEDNPYWHLYMEVNHAADSIDLTPSTTSGALYTGMTADGTKVFFTTADKLLPGEDTDESADLYVAEVGEGSATLHLVSTGSGGTGNTDACDPVENSVHEHWNTIDPSEESCGVVAIGGGGGVASTDGSVYFLSPEKLDGSANGVQDAPNLYLSRPGDGYAPGYVTTLESVLTGPQPPVVGRLFERNFGSFTTATGVAVDHSSGAVYVLDLGTESTPATVQKFDSSGNPVNFSASAGYIAGNKLTGTPGGPFGELAELHFPTQLAVDQSTGKLYVPDLFNGAIDVFAPSGEYLSQIGGLTFPSGVAINPTDGNIYVAGLFGSVSIFKPSGAPVSEFASSFFTASVAVDSAGTIYTTVSGGGTSIYNSSGELQGQLDSNPSQSVAVDPSNDDVYVDEGTQVVHYDSAGNKLDTTGSGTLSGSVGFAVDPGGQLRASSENGTKVATFGALRLLPNSAIDNPTVIDAVSKPAKRATADFQITPGGDDAAFPSTLALAGGEEETEGHNEVYRYDDPTEALTCVSCSPSGAASAGDASLASDGLSLADDGRVFFNTTDQLATFDTDKKGDVYEWEPQGTGDCDSGGPSFGKATGTCLALISAGTGPFSSGLLTASGDATDAYFFTRDSLVPQDENGPTMKVYDARVEGGFPYGFPPEPCKASDECHGASSPAPGPLDVGSSTVVPPGTHGCKKGFVLRHGKCVRKARHHKGHRRGHHRGGGK